MRYILQRKAYCLGQKGQGIVEYAVLVAGVAIIAGIVMGDAGGMKTVITDSIANITIQVTAALAKVSGA